MPDLEQERAAFAWKQAQEHWSSDYTNLAKSAPALIMNNGLMQTLAFYKGKRKQHHSSLLDDICCWLAEQGFSNDNKAGFSEVMSFLHGTDSSKYRRATEEALALLRWIRQFGPALANDKE